MNLLGLQLGSLKQLQTQWHLRGPFSTMNLIVTKLRNRLSAKKTDKLIYIYMNQRVLDKAGDLLLGDWVEKSDEEQVQLEELLLSIDEEDDNTELDEDHQDS